MTNGGYPHETLASPEAGETAALRHEEHRPSEPAISANEAKGKAPKAQSGLAEADDASAIRARK